MGERAKILIRSPKIGSPYPIQCTSHFPADAQCEVSEAMEAWLAALCYLQSLGGEDSCGTGQLHNPTWLEWTRRALHDAFKNTLATWLIFSLGLQFFSPYCSFGVIGCFGLFIIFSCVFLLFYAIPSSQLGGFWHWDISLVGDLLECSPPLFWRLLYGVLELGPL